LVGTGGRDGALADSEGLLTEELLMARPNPRNGKFFFWAMLVLGVALLLVIGFSLAELNRPDEFPLR
jgi:hypothetical protein